MSHAIAGSDLLAAGGTVITATHRLARQLRRQHDIARAAAGDRAWPSADVLPLDAWLRRTWQAGVAGEPVGGDRRLLSDDESRLVWRRILMQKGQGMLDADVLVPLVSGAWRLCQSWAISPAELRRAADSADAREFAHWAGDYLDVLGQRGWLDSGGLQSAVARSRAPLGPEREGPVGFAGFDPWTPALEALAVGLRDAGVTVLAVTAPVRPGSSRLVAASNEEDEFGRACAWAARRAAELPDLPVGIVVADLARDAARVRRIGLDMLAPGWQLREPPVRPLALAAGRQLADYPVVHCALELLSLMAADVTFEQASALLRSPYVGGAATERSARARVELLLRRRPVDRVSLRTLLTLAGSGTEQLAGPWRHAESLAAPVRSRRQLPSEWGGHFSAWLTAAGWPGDRGLASEEYQAAEAWQDLLEAFAGTDDVAGPLALRAGLGLLARQARDRPFEPESLPGTIQVLSPREAEGQAFSALWVCGMTASQWPGPARPHALIPLALQHAVGIPEASAAGIEALTRRRFGRLVASADHVVLSWPAEQEQTATLPSPLLAGMPVAVADAALLQPDRHPDRCLIAASAVPEVVTTDVPPALPAGQAVRGGSRVLALQAVCPARAFVECRLGGTALDPPAQPLDTPTRGRMLHRLLEKLYRLEPCRAGLGHLDPDDLQRLYTPVAQAVLDEFLPAVEPYFASLRQLEAGRLWKLVLSLRELDAQRPGFIVATELERQVSIGPLALRVRLDRIDQLQDGGELVIDYKTGNFQASGWKQPRLPDSQLPLYAVTRAEGDVNPSRGIAVIQLRVPEARLRGVGGEDLAIAGIRSPQAYFGPDIPDWPGALTRWRTQLEQLATEFVAGDFRVNPADRTWAGGQFAGLTRIHAFATAEDGNDEGDGDGDGDGEAGGETGG